MKNYQHLLLCAGLLGATSLSAAGKDKKAAPEKSPNILFILCDDMGYGDLGCYGQRYIQTPNLDRMAQEGMRFTQAYAGSPVSAPSRASLMTGQHTGHGHVRGNKEYWPSAPKVTYGANEDYAVVGQEPYDPQHIILPEVMKNNGYATGVFGKWAGGYEGSCSTPDKRGVDEFYGFICQFQAHLYYPNFLNAYSKAAGDTAVRREVLDGNIHHPMFGDGYKKRTQYSADLIHRKALEWIDAQSGDQPFCGFLTYTLPHAELAQPADSILNHYKKQFFVDKTWGGQEGSRYNPAEHTHAEFAGMITRLDAYVGEILAKLKEKGLDENTLVIFTSDNGPHEEGGADPAFFGRDGKLRGLKRQCYEGGIRVPFIARWPGHVPAGEVNDHQLAFYDVMPTFCELTGDKRFPKKYLNKKLEGDCFDGISFLPTLLGNDEAQASHDYLYWEFHETDQMAVRMGDWKLVVKQGIPHLYDLATDIHEDNDVAALHPEVVKQLTDIVRKEHRHSDLFPITMPEEYYVKHIAFPADATSQQKVDMAARVVPTPQQYAWQQMELSAFLHFGVNTFTGREWGDGKEDPDVFNPTELDAEQWVRTLKEAGFKLVILTAKHHDGFCLWPTATTTHSVAHSTWKNGKGDVVGELRKACEKYDMKFGVYLSPWDRNADCYGDSPKYNEFFIRQLTELLTNYGEVHEVWFDGANGEGPNGKKQVYDWDAFYATIRRLQPHAVMAIMGDDVRWVGNEAGVGRETEWSATVLTPGIYSRATEQRKDLGINNMAKDLGSRDMVARASEVFWYPSEVDVSIRPGWFWNEGDNARVKSLKHLADIYFQSVGCNSVLLLNIPPDRRGLLHEKDVQRLKEFADYRNRAFADDRVQGGKQFWRAASGTSREYVLKEGSEINVVLLQEDITKGQRIEAFTIEALTERGWETVGKGTTVGYKRLLRIPAVKASRLRVKVDACRLKANLCCVGAYYAPVLSEMVEQAKWNNVPREGWKLLQAAPLTIDLGETVSLKNFTYAPAGGEAKPTMAFKYRFFTSLDGKEWTLVPANGEFSNIMHNPVPQTVSFEQAVEARFIRLEAETVEGAPAKVLSGEIGVWQNDGGQAPASGK